MANLEQTLAVALANPDAALFELEKIEAEESLAEFTKQAWHIIEPGRQLKWGWATDAICQHLEAVSSGQIKRLVINVPPGMMKSLLCCVFWPAWEWTTNPWLRHVSASYSDSLSVRDNIRTRRILTSPWYQERWGHVFSFTSDVNAKVKFENDKTGWKLATSVKGIGTGERGDRFVADDPNNVKQSESFAVREDTLQWWSEVVPTRVNDEDSARIVIQQRTHERDVSGYILSQELGYEHLMLPMEFEPKRKCITGIGFEDPRKEEGELLFPERFTESGLNELKAELRGWGGTYAEAGQLQQRPEPRKGGMFEVENMTILDYPPSEVVKVVRYWDKAGTQDSGAYTAGVKIALLADNSYLVLHVARGQWSAGAREKHIQLTAENDGTDVDIWMEQEPGSAGKDVATLSIRALAGYVARPDKVSGQGDKERRAEPYAAQVEVGNVYLLKGSWNHDFIEEHRKFPTGRYKDQVDAAAGAMKKLMMFRGNANSLAAPAGDKQENMYSR